jgi:hypothetical protein
MDLRESISNNLRNIPGWFTNRKIIVFESDDWGSVRMPSKETFTRLKNLGMDLESMDYLRYNLYDTLADQTDLEYLFEILSSVKDKHERNCVFTALSVVANPDFKKIKENNFRKYYYEPFTDTLSRYYGNSGVFHLWEEGIKNRIFIPQFHGREHLNVSSWMTALRNNHKNTVLGFNEGFWGFPPDPDDPEFVENQAAFLISDVSDLQEHQKIIAEGLDLFENIFGYRATYFVPPNGPINNSLNKILIDKGVKFRSTSKIQIESIGPGQNRKAWHWLGQKDTYGIRYITRNCFFEPSGHPETDWIDTCLRDISNAFRWKKPAIISSHRVNYIGSLDQKNRDSGLKKLKILLNSIISKWPDAEFLTTPQLGNFIAGEPPAK